MVTVIIQARMGSSRLPGKILMDLAGKPSLYHVYHRSAAASQVDKVVIATSVSPEDDQVEAFCRLYDIECFRGSENDVLDRFYQAALNAGASKGDVIVRITGDCPVIDPEILDDVVYGLEGGEFDYCSNAFERSYPDGLDAEAMTFETLEYVWKNATWQSEREHVTSYINRNRNEFRISHLKFDEDLSELRWTVDYEDDYLFMKKLYEALYSEDRVFLMEDILDYLKEHPELQTINNSHEVNEGLKLSEMNDQQINK